jgi:hypothetical protein
MPPKGTGRGPRQRRALGQVGGPLEVRGPPELVDPLAAALRVRADEERTRAHVHGFHSYAARLHPDIARRAIEALSQPGDLVLDPFCGSGTVLVEALLAGRRAAGVDASPLAIALSRLKTTPLAEPERTALVTAATTIAEGADARRRAKAGATRRYGREDVSLFDAHVLLELDGLRAGIEAVEDRNLRHRLFLVLSSVLVKVSRQPGESAEGVAPRRLAGGFTARLFASKAGELARRLADFEKLLPTPVPSCRTLVGDARSLDGIGPGSVKLVLSSPPYAGVYDYYRHQALRMRWLGMEARHFERDEIGSRRKLGPLPPTEALERWRRDLGATLAAVARVLRSDGHAALVVADTALGRHAVIADRTLADLAPAAGLAIAASASQRRPHFHGPSEKAFGRRPRREHVVLLRRV